MTNTKEAITFPAVHLANLFSLPEEVLINCIFPQIEYDDLLRLRRMCKYLKTLSDSFIRINFDKFVREINETNYTFQIYLQTNLPTTSIYLNNSSSSIFNDPNILSFLNLHGNKITHLKINHFTTFISENELNFFSNLPNLLHLEINFIDATLRDCSETPITTLDGVVILRGNCPFPPNFKNLKTLKLNQIHGSSPHDHGYPWEFIFFCQNLEYFKHPIFETTVAGGDGVSTPIGGGGPFGCVQEYIKRRHQNNPQNLPNLKFYDLEHFEDTENHYDKFCTLVELCYEYNVKLVNVPGQLLVDVINHFGGSLEKLGSSLVSIVNIGGAAFCTELPFLEKLVIKSVDQSSWMDPMTWRTGRGGVPKWPGLKELDVTIDNLEMPGFHPDGSNFDCCCLELVDFLFPGSCGVREGVRDLAIRNFDVTDGWLDEDDKEVDADFPVFFLNGYVERITETCPFVRRLTLKCWETWFDKGLKMSGFWEGLQYLEEVELDNCNKLEDVAFVGKDWEDPVFLKLKHLKKLVIKKVDRTNLTDELFKKVFCHLKIKEFRMTSNKPVKVITAAGIGSLSEGEFNNFVERFPFTEWSLEGVTEEEFSKLKMKFRASNMI